MSNLFWLMDKQMARLQPYFPRAMAAHALMVDATYLKAHRTASSLLVKKGARAA